MMGCIGAFLFSQEISRWNLNTPKYNSVAFKRGHEVVLLYASIVANPKNAWLKADINYEDNIDIEKTYNTNVTVSFKILKITVVEYKKYNIFTKAKQQSLHNTSLMSWLFQNFSLYIRFTSRTLQL